MQNIIVGKNSVIFGKIILYLEMIYGGNMITSMGLLYILFIGKKSNDRIGNVKKCAVGKHPKSEKLGSTGQAACCARIHSRYFTGGSPSGLRV